jgi:hypothetical protein
MPSTPETLRRARPESTDCTGESAAAAGAKSNADEAHELPDKHRSLHMPIAPIEVKKLSKKTKKALLMSDEMHDYSEIYTPNEEEPAKSEYASTAESPRTGSNDSAISSSSAAALDPPPPPLHRYPSWEGRIYQVACDTIRPATSSALADSSEGSCKRLSAGYGNDVSVPVYAAVKGVRHNQLRAKSIELH